MGSPQRDVVFAQSRLGGGGVAPPVGALGKYTASMEAMKSAFVGMDAYSRHRQFMTMYQSGAPAPRVVRCPAVTCVCMMKGKCV